MANFEKNQGNKIREEANKALSAKPKIGKRPVRTIPVTDVRVGMEVVGLGKVDSVKHFACAKRNTHLNSTKCYDSIATVQVVFTIATVKK